MRIVVEIPEEHLTRLVSATERKDPELTKYLANPVAVTVRDLKSGARLEGRPDSVDPLVVIDNICNCFHLVARRLRERYDNRPTLDVQDEYDVQDLLNAILCMHFRDIRPEEWVPSYAGKNARADFLLKEEKIVVETKMARATLRDRELHDQLIIDIEHYKVHPDCDRVVCFVYDPDGLVRNPQGIENDLNRKEPGFQVTVKIVPRGF